MRRELVGVAVVLILCYSLYGILYLGITGAQADTEVDSDGIDLSDEADRRDGDPVESFDFATVDGEFNYTYETEYTGHMKTLSNAGAYVGDYNNDEWPDVLLVGGERPVLYENVEGSFEPSGALPAVNGTVRSASFLDFDNDGNEDLLLLLDDAPPVLLENTGGEYERHQTFEEPLSRPYGAAVADYNDDGCVDLFVYQTGNWEQQLPVGFYNYSGPVNSDNGNPDVLYRGTCSGFERVEDAGIRGERWTLAASFVDLTGDGLPDIYQTNDINYDVLYVNQGDGTFEQVVMPERTNRNGMSTEVGYFTGNGQLDVFVTNIYYPEWAAEKINNAIKLKARGNNLVSPLSSGEFVDRAEQYGVAKGGWGWAAVAADFDNDGRTDLFHTTRTVTFEKRDVQFTDEEQEELRSKPMYNQPMLFARTSGREFRTVDAEKAGFKRTNGRGVAGADFDRDGDQDLIVATTNEYILYENHADGNAIQVRVTRDNGGTAHGAEVFVNASTRQRFRVQGETDFLSQDTRVIHAGLGNDTEATVRIVYPDGTEVTVEDATAGQRLVVGPDGIRERVPLSDSEQS